MRLMTVLDVVASSHLRYHLCPGTPCDCCASWHTTSVAQKTLMNVFHSSVLYKKEAKTLGFVFSGLIPLHCLEFRTEFDILGY